MGRDYDGVTVRCEANRKSAGPGEEAGVEWLYRVGIDGSILGVALEQRWDGLWDARIEPSGRDLEARRIADHNRIDGQCAAARDGLAGDDQHIEQKLYPVLRQQRARQIPGDADFAILDKAARHGLGVTQVDLG